MAPVVNVVTPLTRAAVAARPSHAGENGMHERLTGRPVVTSTAVPVEPAADIRAQQTAQRRGVVPHGSGSNGDGVASALKLSGRRAVVPAIP